LIVEPARRETFLALMQETYGTAMSPAEFDWWFDRNPAGPRVLNEARDDDGTTLGALAMSFARMSQGLAAFAVHAVTTPAARGRGVFSKLELHNEQEAASAGAAWALGFTNPMAGPILVGRLGWEDVTSLRIWVRPKRLRRTAEGRLRLEPGVAALEREIAAPPRHHVIRDLPYLGWRYVDSPRPYVRVDDGESWAIVTQAVWHGYSSAVVCEAAGGAGILRRAAAAADADLAAAMVNPGEERRYLAAGFVPTPRTIRFIGKRLTDEAPELPKRRDAWYFTLGDLDFF
jgi:GNAT superfamily N-acetyltransferase